MATIKVEDNCDYSVPSDSNAAQPLQMTPNDFDARLQRIETMASDIQVIKSTVQDIKALEGVKKGEIARSNTDSLPSFLRVGFNIKSSDGKIKSSEEINLGGATWCLKAGITENNLGTNFIGVSFYCETHTKDLSYNVDYTISLLGQASQASDRISHSFKRTFDWLSKCFHHFHFIAWSDLINKDYGFIDEEENILILVEFSFEKKTNSKAFFDVTFLDSSLVKKDCTLVVEDRRLAVSKGLLSTYSTYFNTLFFGEFSKKDQNEFQLKNVNAVEFICLLKVIYLPVDNRNNKNVNAKNVECLLRLADNFQVRIVTLRCLNFLKECPATQVSLAQKLVLAQNYNLSDLLEVFIKQFKTLDDLKNLVTSSFYSLLNNEIKIRAYENCSKFGS